MKGFIFFIIFFLISSSSVFASDVVLNEILANPNSGEKEWIEIYNSTDSSFDLSNYYFDDDELLLVSGEIQKGSADPGSDPIKLDGILNSKSTCFVTFSSYLNNDKDKPTIFLSDGTVIDSYEYVDSVQNKSFSRVPDGAEWQVNQEPSKSNTECSSLAPIPTSTQSPTSTPTPTSKPTASVKLSPTIKIVYTNMPLSTYNKVSLDNPTSIPLATKKPSNIPSSETNTPSPKKLVLGQNEKPTQVQKPKQEVKIASFNNNFPKILIGLGSFLIISCAILLFQKLRKGEIENN